MSLRSDNALQEPTFKAMKQRLKCVCFRRSNRSSNHEANCFDTVPPKPEVLLTVPLKKAGTEKGEAGSRWTATAKCRIYTGLENLRLVNIGPLGSMPFAAVLLDLAGFDHAGLAGTPRGAQRTINPFCIPAAIHYRSIIIDIMKTLHNIHNYVPFTPQIFGQVFLLLHPPPVFYWNYMW